MSNAKKILEGKAKKLRVVQRVRRIRLDLNAMAPAYVSGSLQLQPKTRIVFASKEDGKIHEGTFFNTYQDALNVWDETAGHFAYVWPHIHDVRIDDRYELTEPTPVVVSPTEEIEESDA